MQTDAGTKLSLPSNRATCATAAMIAGAWLITMLTPSLAAEHSLAPRYIAVLAGVVPWLLQLVAVLIILRSVLRDQNRSAILFAGTMAAIVGISWWIGVFLKFRGNDATELLVNLVGDAIISHYAGESLGHAWTHRVCGPVISIFELSGPVTLTGWTFLSTLASLTIVISWLCFVAEGIRTRPGNIRALVGGILAMATIWLPGLVATLLGRAV